MFGNKAFDVEYFFSDKNEANAVVNKMLENHIDAELHFYPNSKIHTQKKFEGTHQYGDCVEVRDEWGVRLTFSIGKMQHLAELYTRGLRDEAKNEYKKEVQEIEQLRKALEKSNKKESKG